MRGKQVTINKNVLKVLLQHFGYSMFEVSEYKYLTNTEKSFITEEFFNQYNKNEGEFRKLINMFAGDM